MDFSHGHYERLFDELTRCLFVALGGLNEKYAKVAAWSDPVEVETWQDDDRVNDRMRDQPLPDSPLTVGIYPVDERGVDSEDDAHVVISIAMTYPDTRHEPGGVDVDDIAILPCTSPLDMANAAKRAAKEWAAWSVEAAMEVDAERRMDRDFKPLDHPAHRMADGTPDPLDPANWAPRDS